MKVAILGYGVVGSGVFEVLNSNRDHIAAKTGEAIEVKRVLDLRTFPGDPVESVLTHEFDDIVNDPEIETVIETMGGTGAAYKFDKASLLAGKNLVTSNKAIVAKYGAEFLQIAREKNLNFFFEASVGGGIPIIRPLRTCLIQEKAERIDGILNGTTNYILTKMYDEGADYAETLKEAQSLGYAEADPTADVEGFDAARKIAILSSMVLGRQVDFEDIYTVGISKITKKDIAYAKAAKAKIKLVAGAELDSHTPKITVCPRLVFKSSALYAIDDVINSVLVTGNMLGEAAFTGSGAGKLPTASAVVGDVIETLTSRGKHFFVKWAPEKIVPASKDTVSFRNFIVVKNEYEDAVCKAFDVEQDLPLRNMEGVKAFTIAETTEAKFDECAAGIPLECRIRLL